MFSAGHNEIQVKDGSLNMTPEREDSNDSSDHHDLSNEDISDNQSCSSETASRDEVNKLSSPLALKLDLAGASPTRSDEVFHPRVENIINLFKELTQDEKIHTYSRLLDESSMENIRELRKLIEPHFQRDFLSCLPFELGLNIIRQMDGNDIVRLSGVSRNWRHLSEVPTIWRNLMDKMKMKIPDPTHRMGGAWAATAVGYGVNIPDHLKKYSLYSYRHFKIHNRVGSVYERAIEKAKFVRMNRIAQNWRERPIRGSCVLKGHDDHVITCMQIHGDLLVTGSDDNTLKVWSIDHGEIKFTLLGHTGGVWTSQISSCGKYIISGSTDRTVKVWDAENGCLLHTLQGHTSTVRCMAMCNNILVTGSRDTTLRVWDVEKGTCHAVLSGHHAAVRCVQFDGNLVVSGGYDFSVKIWSAKTGNCIRTLVGHTNRVYSLLFDRERSIVASGSLDTTIRVWNFENEEGKECIAVLNGHTSLTSGMQLRGNILVSCNADSHVRVWDIRDSTCIFHLIGHRSAITSLQFFGDDLVATSSDDGTVKLWDVKRGSFLRDLVVLESGGSGGCIWRLCATPTLLACAVGSRNSTEETKVILIDFDSVFP